MSPEHEPRAHDVESEHEGLHPQIYVASLADYNAGRLYGTWIDATLDLEEIEEAVQGMLAASPQWGAEEYAIHDYDEFGCLHLDEFTDLATVSRVARGIAEYGCAFGHWADYVGFDPDQMDRFEEVYRGHWPSLEAYAQDLLDDLGVMDEIEQGIPEWVRPYVSIDWRALGNDIAVDACAVERYDGVWVYEI